MSKRLLLLASSLLSFILPAGQSYAQSDPNLFKLPDTVCNGHDIVPFNIIQTAENYFWTFCPPNMNAAPVGNNIGPVTSINNTKGIVVAEDDSANYTFHINTGSGLVRMKYADGLNGTPSMITGLGTSALTNPGGIFLTNNGLWHLFVVAGTDSANSRLFRYDFNENGLKSMPTEMNLGSLGGALNGPNQLYIAKQGNDWFGFTFTKTDQLLRLSFGADLLSTPTVENLGNIDGHFSKVSGISAIMELDNWHLFVTNRGASTLNRISFGNSLTNTPFVVDLGNMNNRINAPIGVTVTKDCDAYYGYVINYGTAAITTLRWDNQSIANQPVATNHGNIGGYQQPSAMSALARDGGAIYILNTNNLDNSISKTIFNSCSEAVPAYSDLRLPPSFQILEPGWHTVFLTINEGLPSVQTDCEQIYIYDHTPLTISNDTMICQRDTIRLSALSFGVDSFVWSPNYNIDTTMGQFVDIWPDVTTEYTVTSYYDYNCIVKSPINVTVSKITADAGPDRIVRDGASSIVGGAGTTTGTQYTYLWTPNIGFTGSRDSAITSVRPPYDITYYLNITNTDGCSTIDSVLITVPCDNISLPNAFYPGSANGTARFGLLNQQLVKINYFKIFDRWGKEVFSTTNPSDKWDGRVDGTDAPLGVYVWEIDANCANTQQRFRRNGTVTLIR